MNLAEMDTDGYARAILFGPSKAGKSELVSKLAYKHKLVWFDNEKGWAVLKKLPKEVQKNVTLITLPDTQSYPIAIETMLKVIKGGEHKICQEHGKCNCLLCRKDGKYEEVVNLSTLGKDTIVVVDSATQLVASAIAQIARGEADDFKFGYDEWAKLGKLCDIFFSHIQQGKFNSCVITHETEVEMEDGKNKLVPTGGTRNYSRGVSRFFDTVVYCELKNKEHKFGSATTYAMNILTGSRTDVKLEGMKEVSLEDIFPVKLGSAGGEVEGKVPLELIPKSNITEIKLPQMVPDTNLIPAVSLKLESMAEKLARLKGAAAK